MLFCQVVMCKVPKKMVHFFVFTVLEYLTKQTLRGCSKTHKYPPTAYETDYTFHKDKHSFCYNPLKVFMLLTYLSYSI